MRRLVSHQSIPVSLISLGALVAALLFLLPPERTLGDVIKAVFLHGALVRTGLIAFAVTGILGLAALVWNVEPLHRWCLAALKTAGMVWGVYALSSMVATYLAWGVVIAWDEPRVQASARVLGAYAFLLTLALWVNDRRLTAAVSIVIAVLTWMLTKGAINIRHPFDPIGSSDSAVFRWFFAAISATILLIAFQVARWLCVVQKKRSQAASS